MELFLFIVRSRRGFRSLGRWCLRRFRSCRDDGFGIAWSRRRLLGIAVDRYVARVGIHGDLWSALANLSIDRRVSVIGVGDLKFAKVGSDFAVTGRYLDPELRLGRQVQMNIAVASEDLDVA